MKDWVQSIDAYMNFLITLSKSNGYLDLELVLCVAERRDTLARLHEVPKAQNLRQRKQ